MIGMGMILYKAYIKVKVTSIIHIDTGMMYDIYLSV